MYDPVGILEAPNVRAFFLSILESELSSERKYQQFLDFFRERTEIESQLYSRGEQLANADEAALNRAVSQVGQAIGFWNPRQILEQTGDSIRRAIGRLKIGQHRDGGWGYEIETSGVWGTAYAVLCLNSARSLQQLKIAMDLEPILSRGVNWLQEHRLEWTVEDLHPQGAKPVYDLHLVFRCLSGVKEPLQPEMAGALDEITARIASSQNQDGGWDAVLWGAERWPIRVWSEVGATSCAIRALAEARHPAPLALIQKGLDWLMRTQNEDGSWNSGSCRPEKGPFELTGVPVITKTCDAVKGLTVALDLGLEVDQVKPHTDKAVQWLRRQEKPLLDSDRRIQGWGWTKDRDDPGEDRDIAADQINTAMTLETLVSLPDEPLEFLTSSAVWLIQNQFQQDGHEQDGSWHSGDTARVALALIDYYRKISASSLFEVSE